MRKRHITLGPQPNGPTCKQCVLSGRCDNGPRDPVGSGFAAPYGAMTNGIMLVTEALDSTDDVKAARALAGRGGFLMERVMRKYRGWKLDEFRVVPSLFCFPNQPMRGGKPLSLTRWAADALLTCAPNLDAEIEKWQPKVIVTLGEVATAALIGTEHPMMACHGYAFRDRKNRAWVVPTFDPTWIMMGNHTYAHIMLQDIEKALRMAQDGYTYESPECLLDPPREVWDRFVSGYLSLPVGTPLALDIETPYKRDEDEDELDTAVPTGPQITQGDISFTVERYSFAYRRADGTDVAVSIAALPHYTDGVKKLVARGSLVC